MKLRFIILIGIGILCNSSIGAAAKLTRAQINTFYDLKKIKTEPLNVKILDKKEVENGKIILEEIEYTSEKTEKGEYRIFAYYAYPKDSGKKVPGQLYIRGGLAPGIAKDAIEGASHGYATITIHQPGKARSRSPETGWKESWNCFPVLRHEKLSDWWLYHSCSALMRAITFLQSRPEVDPETVAVCGQSWGGFLTVMVSGIDKRVKAAVPVFGCGFFETGTYWDAYLAKMDPQNRRDWLTYFDPGTYAAHIKCPVLYMTASNDWAYWLKGFIKTYEAMPSKNKRAAIYVNGSHAISPAMYGDRWKWLDLYCKKEGSEFPAVKNITFQGGKGKLSAEILIDSTSETVNVELAYSEGENNVPPSRLWSTAKAVKGTKGNWQADIPVYFTERPVYLFVNISDKDGHFISSIPQRVLPSEHGVKEAAPLPEQPVIADKSPYFGNGKSFKAVKTHQWVQEPESKAVCEYDPKEKFKKGKVLKADCSGGKQLLLTREPHHYALKVPGRYDYTFKIRLKSATDGQEIFLGLYNIKTGKSYSKSVKLSTEWKYYQIGLKVPEADTEGLLARIYVPQEKASGNIWMSDYILELK